LTLSQSGQSYVSDNLSSREADAADDLSIGPAILVTMDNTLAAFERKSRASCILSDFGDDDGTDISTGCRIIHRSGPKDPLFEIMDVLQMDLGDQKILQSDFETLDQSDNLSQRYVAYV
jgi:hypothetical protein